MSYPIVSTRNIECHVGNDFGRPYLYFKRLPDESYEDSFAIRDTTPKMMAAELRELADMLDALK